MRVRALGYLRLWLGTRSSSRRRRSGHLSFFLLGRQPICLLAGIIAIQLLIATRLAANSQVGKNILLEPTGPYLRPGGKSPSTSAGGKSKAARAAPMSCRRPTWGRSPGPSLRLRPKLATASGSRRCLVAFKTTGLSKRPEGGVVFAPRSYHSARRRLRGEKGAKPRHRTIRCASMRSNMGHHAFLAPAGF
jgi:hypothetical protein